MSAELAHLKMAIAALEAQRDVLGEAGLAAALAPLLARVAALEEPERPADAGERKQITVMFADLSGFTKLSESADAEDVRNLVNACFDCVGDVVTHFGGYIDKFIGDELMVLFGAPRAMEDHASRALHAALEMRDALAAFRLEHAPLRAHELSMHFGVNSGEVIAGEIGSESRRAYTVMGDAVNVAARLVARAGAGEILVGADARRLVGPGFDFEGLGAVALDGREQPVEVFRLVAASIDARSARGAVAQTPMFGRASELRTMRDLFGDVVAGRRPRSVSVIGPAGIGKSRLLAEFRLLIEADHPGTVMLHGAALPHMTATPYFVSAEIIRNLLGVHAAESGVEIRGRLAASLASAGIEDAETGWALATLMAVEPEESDMRGITPQEGKARIFAAAERVLRGLADRNPILLSFEDLHWSDDLSIELLDHLFATLTDVPILFLTLTRPIADVASKARQVEARLPHEAHRRVVLAELDERTSAEFVAGLAPGLERSPHAVRTIVRKGQGNPFFIESIVGTLTDQGVLVRGDHGVTVAKDIGDVSVPDTVWGVLAERIDRLPPDEKRVVQTSAIVGRLFWEGLVRELTRLPTAGELQALNQRDFVDRIGPAAFADDWEWMFRHVLVQEVAYSGLLRETRRAGHLAAAAWLEERIGDRRHEYGTLLAHHYLQGEEWARASEYAELAGDRAAGLYAHREARLSYANALTALEHLAGDPATVRRRIDVALKLARVAFYTPTDDVWQALEAAKALAEQLDDRERRLRAITAMASWLYMAGRGRPAVELAIQCVAGATEAGLDELLVVPYVILGRAMFLMGDYAKCAEMIEKSNELAETYGMELQDRSSTGFLGLAYQQLGETARADAALATGLRTAEEERDLRRIASAHLYAGSATAVGRLEGMEDHLRRAVSLSEEVGDMAVLYVSLGHLGYWYAQTGQVERAREALDQALSIAAELDSVLFLPLLQSYRAGVDIMLGRPEDAMALAERAVAVAQETRQEGSGGEAWRVLGWARHYARPGEPAEAEQALRTALEVHRKTRGRVLEARTLFDLAAFLRLTGDEAGASEARAAAESLTRELSVDWLPAAPPAPVAASAVGDAPGS